MSKLKFEVVLVGKSMGDIGGLQAVNRSLSQALISDSVGVTIFSYREVEHRAAARLLGMTYDILRFSRLLVRPKKLVVFNITGMEIIFFALMCMIRRQPFAFWLHGDPNVIADNSSSVFLSKFLFKFATSVVVLHDEFAQRLSWTGARIKVIPNIVPQAAPKKNADKVLDKFSRVVWIGRLGEEKNPSLAYYAMLELASRHPAIEFSFISPGARAGEVFPHRRPENFLLVDGSKFVPHEYFDESTLHLLTSTLEAMPGVLFESASCGSMFISTACSPWVSDLEALEHGVSVPVNISVDELVIQIDKVLKNGPRHFCKNSVKKFLEKYNVENVAKKWKLLINTGR